MASIVSVATLLGFWRLLTPIPARLSGWPELQARHGGGDVRLPSSGMSSLPSQDPQPILRCQLLSGQNRQVSCYFFS